MTRTLGPANRRYSSRIALRFQCCSFPQASNDGACPVPAQVAHDQAWVCRWLHKQMQCLQHNLLRDGIPCVCAVQHAQVMHGDILVVAKVLTDTLAYSTYKPTSGSSGASQITLLSPSFSRNGKLSWSGCPERYRLSSTIPKFGGGTSIVTEAGQGCYTSTSYASIHHTRHDVWKPAPHRPRARIVQLRPPPSCELDLLYH